MTKKEIYDYITKYAKEHNISKRKYSLFPLYIHLDGFSHSIGFINHKAKANVREYDYTSVGYSNYMSECEGKVWGFENDYQKEIAEHIFKNIGHLFYQNNAQEILF